tara:strand:- start:438 stop:1271 length:834 start_codon:yes stop_codon:yes gene_type:complete
MSLKEKIEDYLIQTYDIEFDCGIQFHPIRIVESMKSLIGIEPQKPNKLILNYFQTYLNDFKIKYKTDTEISQVEYFASMINLEILLQKNKFDQSRIEIQRLLQVSSGEPILEILLLLYLKDINLLSCLFSIFRSVKFCNGRNIKQAIFLMLDIIEEYQKSDKIFNKLHYLDYSTSILEISQNTFIRDVEIKNILQKIDYKMIYNKIRFYKKTKLGEDLIENGRSRILDYINKHPDILKNNKNILLMDSIRTILRYRKSSEYDNHLHFSVSELELNDG